MGQTSRILGVAVIAYRTAYDVLHRYGPFIIIIIIIIISSLVSTYKNKNSRHYKVSDKSQS